MRRWTEQTDEKADVFFRTLTMKELRHRQGLATQQMAAAYEQRNETALLDLQAMHDALTREVARRVS